MPHGVSCGRCGNGAVTRAPASSAFPRTGGRGADGARPTANGVEHAAEGGVYRRRIPKRGFTNSFALTVAEVNLAELEATFDAGTAITAELLQAKGLLRRKFDVLKILGNGNLTKKFSVTAHRFSASAKQKLEAAGGSAVEIPVKVTVAEKKEAKALADGKKKKSKS